MIGEQAVFRVQAWMTTPRGEWIHADNIPIRIQTISGLEISPDSGMGALACRIDALKPGSYSIQATGAIPTGTIETRAVVTVLPAPLILSISPPRLSLDVGGREQITIQAEREVFTGKQVVTEAVIELELPPEIERLEIQEAGEGQGHGSLAAALQIKDDAAPGSYKIIVTGKVEEETVRAEIKVEILPVQVWRFSFEKTMWQTQAGTALESIEGVPCNELRSLGLDGGKLVVKPRGFTPAGYDEKKIETSHSIQAAPVCQLERSNGEVIVGNWDGVADGYLFHIPPLKSQNAIINHTIVVKVPILFNDKWGDQIRQIVEAARELGQGLDSALPDVAETYAVRFLDQFAQLDEFTLYQKREQLRAHLLTTGNFLAYMKTGTALYESSLGLFDAAFCQIKDNLIDLNIETTFSSFELFSMVLDSATPSAKQALEGVANRTIVQIVEHTIEQLGAKAIEQQARVAEARDARTQSLDEVEKAESMLGKFLKGTSQQKRQLKLVGELLTQDQALFRQILDEESKLKVVNQARKFFIEQVQANADKSSREELHKVLQESAGQISKYLSVENLLQDTAKEQNELVVKMVSLRAELLLTVKAIGEDPDEKAALESQISIVESQINRILQNGLWEADPDIFAKLQIEQSPSELVFKTKELTSQAQKEAATISSQNRNWEDYETWLTPVGIKAGEDFQQIPWLDDVANNFIPSITNLERWLSYAVDTAIIYLLNLNKAVVEFISSPAWRRTGITAQYRESGRQAALKDGNLNEEFYTFPKTLRQLARQCYPRNLVSMGRSGQAGEKDRVKGVIQSSVDTDHRREVDSQKEQAKKFFSALCINILDPARLSHDSDIKITGLDGLNQIWKQLAKPIIAYEKRFTTGSQTETGTPWSNDQFIQNITLRDWDGAISWLAWGLAWSLQLGSLAEFNSGNKAESVSNLSIASQGVEWITAHLKPMIAALIAMPDIIGFQFDLILAAALAYEAVLTRNVDIPSLIVDRYMLE